jgi:hypothetical protein
MTTLRSPLAPRCPPSLPPAPPMISPASPQPPPPILFSSYFHDPSFWAPYVPLAENVVAKHSIPITAASIYKELGLPFNLYTLNEKDRMALAHAFEERAILVSTLAAAQHRHRQQVILARACEVDVLQLQDQLQEFSKKLDMAVITALSSVATATNTADDHQDMSQPPWNRPRLPRKNPDMTLK